jgi:hypothetical protein
MKNLVIHPNDSTTIFLTSIYESLPNTTIVSDCLSKKVLIEMIKSHDRILVLGHGSSKGLFNPDTLEFLVDATFSKVLKDKVGLYIFCNADKFVSDNRLNNCFYSGMFVSQADEIGIYSDAILPDEYVNYTPMIEESNKMFASQLGKLINEKEFNLAAIFNGIKKHYGSLHPKTRLLPTIVTDYFLTLKKYNHELQKTL